MAAGHIDYASIIKESISIKSALEFYGVEFNRFGYALCPFHNENTGSLRVKNDYFHCFGCGAGGDVIKFVQAAFKLEFKGALAKLNQDFGLNLPIGEKPTMRQACEAEIRMQKIKLKREQAEADKKANDNLYHKLWNEFDRLEANKRKYAPKSPDEPLHPLFAEALNKLDYQKYLIETLL